jgi:hypothetical protein
MEAVEVHSGDSGLKRVLTAPVGFDGKYRYIWSGLRNANKQGGTADNLRPFLGDEGFNFCKT